MRTDPLDLHKIRTPEVLRVSRARPDQRVIELYNRIISNQFADSLETKVVLLTHLCFLAYQDLKESVTP